MQAFLLMRVFFFYSFFCFKLCRKSGQKILNICKKKSRLESYLLKWDKSNIVLDTKFLYSRKSSAFLYNSLKFIKSEDKIMSIFFYKSNAFASNLKERNKFESNSIILNSWSSFFCLLKLVFFSKQKIYEIYCYSFRLFLFLFFRVNLNKLYMQAA